MDPSLAGLVDLFRTTLTEPRDAVRRVLGMNLPEGARWQALVLGAILSTLLSQAAVLMLRIEALAGAAPGSPFLAFALQLGALGLMAALIDRIGRAFGGRGSFPDALILVVWLQFVMVAVQLAQLFVLLILPPLASLVTIASIVLLFWLLTVFVAELHGFRSRVQVFLMILVSLFALSFVLALVLALLGVRPPEV